MFDIGFTELIVIGVVALIVIGPDRLPGVARTAGRMLGKAQRLAQEIKNEIGEDAALQELRGVGKELRTQAQALRAGGIRIGQVVVHEGPQSGVPAYAVGQVILHDQPEDTSSPHAHAQPDVVLDQAAAIPARPGKQQERAA